ncbi:MAG TPA: hypothetical protein VG370_06215 [Chloroflexota bacterium]|nr:hypothetical protein [Chloroflexota bacterium]
MATVTARLADWLDRELRAFWAAHGEDPSAGLRRVVEEWWAMQRFPGIEFRDGPSGRRAALREGPDVWEVAMVARDYGGDLDGLVAHFGGFIPRTALAEALAYAERFPEEIGRRVDENERIGRSLGGQPAPR